MKRILALALLLPLPLQAQNNVAPRKLFTGPFGKDGTWNLYEVVPTSRTWLEAHKFAMAQKDPLGATNKLGHLVTISSIEENMFCARMTPDDWVLWIGLADDEIVKGASESNGARKGWAWVTGEPVTFTHWEPDEPNNSHPRFPLAGEDAASIGWAGFWNDLPIRAVGPAREEKGCIIEWDLQANRPITGAEAFTPVLPAKLPPMPPTAKNQRPAAWLGTVYRISGTRGVRAHARLRGKQSFYTQTVNHIYGTKGMGAGWLPVSSRFPAPATLGSFGARFHSRLKIDQAGKHTIVIHADDHFACRIGSRSWSSAHGRGGIDPLDPTTIYQEKDHADGFVLGIIDLPAGDHPIDIFFSNSGGAGMVQVFAAAGSFTQLGATDRWRLIGHQPKGEIPWPGIDEKGWKVTWTTPTPIEKWQKHKLQDALLRVRTGKTSTKAAVKQISYLDPDTSGENRFPDAAPFPGDKPDNLDRFIIQVSANLEIPADGTYHIGFHTEDAGALRIKGVEWQGTIRDSSGRAKISGDTIACEPGKNGLLDSQVVGIVSLKKGFYPIEVLYPRNKPVGVLEVFGSLAGYPPRLLRVGGAEITKDHAGITVVGPAAHPQTP